MFQKSESYQKLTPYVGEMQTEFQKLQCVDETASFWIIKGMCLFFVDKATGEIYYKLGESNTGSGSYIETVGKLEETYENLFEICCCVDDFCVDGKAKRGVMLMKKQPDDTLVQAEPVLFDKEASLKKVLNYIDEPGCCM